MTIIINSEILPDLKIKILKKTQKISCNHNYYFSPNMGMHLYNAKVTFINPKFIVFEFDKRTHLNLLLLMRKTNDRLQTELKKNFSELFDKEIYDIVSEKDESFSIRCFLPNTLQTVNPSVRQGTLSKIPGIGTREKYNIICKSNQNENLTFKLPRLECIFSEITIEIKNVWENGDKRGYNIELKSVKYP